MRRWSRFDPSSEDGIAPVAEWLEALDTDYIRRRLDPDWFVRAPDLRRELVQRLQEQHPGSAFWGTAG